MRYKKTFVTILCLAAFALFTTPVAAQATNQYWKVLSGILQPVLDAYQVKLPYLGGSGTLCLHTDNSGNVGTSSADCGSGGSAGDSKFATSTTDSTAIHTASAGKVGINTVVVDARLDVRDDSSNVTGPFTGPSAILGTEINSPTNYFAGDQVSVRYYCVYSSGGQTYYSNSYADSGTTTITFAVAQMDWQWGEDCAGSPTDYLLVRTLLRSGAYTIDAQLVGIVSGFIDSGDTWDVVPDVTATTETLQPFVKSLYSSYGATLPLYVHSGNAIDPITLCTYIIECAHRMIINEGDASHRAYFTNINSTALGQNETAFNGVVANPADPTQITSWQWGSKGFGGGFRLGFTTNPNPGVGIAVPAMTISTGYNFGLNIGDTEALSTLGVGNNAAIGASYGLLAAPTNGLIVQGSVGIGTSSPYSMLSVAGQVVAQNYIATSTTATSTFYGDLASLRTTGTTTSFIQEFASSGSGNLLQFYKARGTQALPSAVCGVDCSTGDILGQINFGGATGATTYKNDASSIIVRAGGSTGNGTWGTGGQSNQMEMYITKTNQSTPTQWLRVTPDGVIRFFNNAFTIADTGAVGLSAGLTVPSGSGYGYTANNIYIPQDGSVVGSRLMSQNAIAAILDSDANGTTDAFTVRKDATTISGSTELFRINDAGNIGVGATTTPSAQFSIVGSSTINSIYVSSTTAPAASTTLYMVDKAGWVHYGGGTPVLSGCGTTPTLDANSTDQAGTVTFGATAAGCTVTFSIIAPSAPHCVVAPRAISLINAYTVAPTATSIVITQAASGGTTWDYFCPLGH